MEGLYKVVKGRLRKMGQSETRNVRNVSGQLGVLQAGYREGDWVQSEGREVTVLFRIRKRNVGIDLRNYMAPTTITSP
jgi:hypothetical protein